MGCGVCGVWGGWGSRDVLLNHLERHLKNCCGFGLPAGFGIRALFPVFLKHQTGY